MKKKFRLLSFILAILLLFTACTATGNSQRGKELGYFNYPGLDWGMTEAEFFKAIGKNADAFRTEHQENSGEQSAYVQYYILENAEFLGSNAQIVFTFSSYAEEHDARLSSVTVEYDADFDYAVLYENLLKTLDGQDVAYYDVPSRAYVDESGKTKYAKTDEELLNTKASSVQIGHSIYSEATIADLPEEMIEKANKGYEKLVADTGLRGTWAEVMGEENLSTVNFVYLAEHNDAGERINEKAVIYLFGRVYLADLFGDLAG